MVHCRHRGPWCSRWCPGCRRGCGRRYRCRRCGRRQSRRRWCRRRWGRRRWCRRRWCSWCWCRWCWRGRRRRSCARDHRRDVFVQRRDHPDELSNRCRRSLGHQTGAQDTVTARHQLHDRLVRLDFGQNVAGLHRVALVLVPLHETPLFHRWRERFHHHLGRHRKDSGGVGSVEIERAADRGDGLRHIGLGCLFQPLGIWHRRVCLRDTNHR